MVNSDVINLAKDIERLLANEWSFSKLETPKKVISVRDDQILLLNLGPVHLAVLSDGQIELYGPIYNCYIEKLDYRNNDEAISKVKFHLDQIQNNFDKLQRDPVKIRPILNVLVDKMKYYFKKN